MTCADVLRFIEQHLTKSQYRCWSEYYGIRRQTSGVIASARGALFDCGFDRVGAELKAALR